MLFPHTASRRIVLRPASASDAMTFYETLLQTGLESLYAISGKSGMFKADAVFLATRRTDGEVLGFSTLQSLSDAGHIRTGVYLNSDRTRFGIGSEAVQLTINYGFAVYNIDRMMIETTEASLPNFGSDATWDTREGTLADHLYFRGRYFDLQSYWLRRSYWDSYVDGVMGGVLADHLSWREAPR